MSISNTFKCQLSLNWQLNLIEVCATQSRLLNLTLCWKEQGEMKCLDYLDNIKGLGESFLLETVLLTCT